MTTELSAANSNVGKTAILCGGIFQLVWFICVLAPAPAVIPAVVIFLILYCVFISRRTSDFLFAVLVATLGYSVDSIWLYLGVITMPTQLPPYWLALLWFVFALSLPYAFAFLRARPFIALIVGGVGGAFSYFTAITLRGDLDFGVPVAQAVLCIGLWWSLLFPLALRIWGRYFTRIAV